MNKNLRKPFVQFMINDPMSMYLLNDSLVMF